MVEHTPNQVKRKSEWLWTWLGMMLAKKVVLLTEEYDTELKKKMGIWFRKRKVSVIPNGIDIKYYKLIEKKDCLRQPCISMVARFSSTKGQALLLKAFSIVKQQLKIHNLRLILAGDGETRKAVEELCEQLQLQDSVHFPGTLNEEEIKVLLQQQTSVYVHATYGETMSTSIMQALACGLPVIASDIPGVHNLVKPGHGITVKNDAHALATAIEEVLLDPMLMAQLSDKARYFAQTYLSQDLMFSRYNALMESKSRSQKAIE